MPTAKATTSRHRSTTAHRRRGRQYFWESCNLRCFWCNGCREAPQKTHCGKRRHRTCQTKNGSEHMSIDLPGFGTAHAEGDSTSAKAATCGAIGAVYTWLPGQHPKSMTARQTTSSAWNDAVKLAMAFKAGLKTSTRKTHNKTAWRM